MKELGLTQKYEHGSIGTCNMLNLDNAENIENQNHFRKKGNDRFIDFLKGFAIVSVVLLHNLGHTVLNRYGAFCLWIGQAVPPFILIQSVNTYRSYIDTNEIGVWEYFRIRSKKIFIRVFKPFLFLQFFIAVLYLLLQKGDFSALTKEFIRGAGFGPGAYYPWVYLQIFLFLPFVIWIYKKSGPIKAFLIVGGAAIILEWLCQSFDITENTYRVFAVRYIFMTTCGIFVMEKGFHPNKAMLNLSFIGLVFILLDSSTAISFYPIAYKSLGFPGQHWIAYFYTSFWLLFLLKKIHNRLHSSLCSRMIEYFGKNSYSIFLIQMLVFWLMRNNGWASYNISFNTVFFVLMSTFLSLVYSLVKFCIMERNNNARNVSYE